MYFSGLLVGVILLALLESGDGDLMGVVEGTLLNIFSLNITTKLIIKHIINVTSLFIFYYSLVIQNIINCSISEQKMASVAQTFSAINGSINSILQKGGQMIYDKYLTNAKLPFHAAQIGYQTLTENLNGTYQVMPQRKKIRIQTFARNINAESLSIGSVPQRPKSQLHKRRETASFTISKKANQQNENNKPISIHIKKFGLGAKPNMAFKNQCEKYDEHAITQEQLRKQVIEKERIRGIIDEQIRVRNQKLNQRRRQLQEKFNRLIDNNVSFTYDFDSPNPIPCDQVDPKKKKKITHEKKVISLKYQTIDFDISSKEPQIRDIVGRKKGVFTNRIKKRQKITNKQYNNNDQRQYSTIPFMTLREGIKVVQTALNVVAIRNRSPEPSKDEFIKLNKNKRFKSFMPGRTLNPQERGENTNEFTLSNLYRTMEISRPGTCNNTSGKQTAATGATARSILWRPHTTQGNHRIKMNKDLAQEMMIV